MTDQLIEALADLDEESVLRIVCERLDAKEDPQSLLAACQQGMTTVGQRYESGEYFLSELIMAGEIFKQVNLMLASNTIADPGIKRGKIVFGTVKNDIHDLGKDLVIGMLRGAGYEVIDLGIDVPAVKFVDAVQTTGATIVGLSGLLTVAFDSMKATIDALETAGLRPGVKVMIGGSLVSDMVLKFTGADAFGTNPQRAVEIANQWSSG